MTSPLFKESRQIMAPNGYQSIRHENERSHLEHDGPPFNRGLEADNFSYIQTVRPEVVKPKTKTQRKEEIIHSTGIRVPPKPKSKKKKSKAKKSSSDDEKIPSPTSSLESLEEGEIKTKNFVRNMGFSDHEVTLAADILRKKQLPFTTENLLDTVYDVSDELLSLPSVASDSSKLQTDGPSVDVSPHPNVQQSEDEEDEDDDACSVESEEDTSELYRRAVDKEKMRIRDMIDELTITCRVCNCSRATILLLPCGHLVCCDDCLMDVRRCPIHRCNKIVRGTKEVYFS